MRIGHPSRYRAPVASHKLLRHSLLAWGIVLLGMAVVILAAWWLSTVHLDF